MSAKSLFILLIGCRIDVRGILQNVLNIYIYIYICIKSFIWDNQVRYIEANVV